MIREIFESRVFFWIIAVPFAIVFCTFAVAFSAGLLKGMYEALMT